MKQGLSPNEFLKSDIIAELNKEKQQFEILTALSTEERAEYSLLLEKLMGQHEAASVSTTAEKGKTLEKLVSFLFESTHLYEAKTNLRTSSNEIDTLMSLNENGRRHVYNGLHAIKNDLILAESKNYHGKISVTWVGKVQSLMQYTDCRLAIIFSYHGLSGKDWKDAVGLTKKIYLGSPKDDKYIILDFNLKDFQKVNEGIPFLSLIYDKIISLRTDTNFESAIAPHPAEEQ